MFLHFSVNFKGKGKSDLASDMSGQGNSNYAGNATANGNSTANTHSNGLAKGSNANNMGGFPSNWTPNANNFSMPWNSGNGQGFSMPWNNSNTAYAMPRTPYGYQIAPVRQPAQISQPTATVKK